MEKGVQSEFTYYKANKNIPGVTYTAVDDSRIYAFVEEVYALPFGNPIFSFETGADIAEVLRVQWAGLFQRLLAQDSQRAQANVLEELQRSLSTVDQMVKFLMEEKTKGSAAINEILFANHPLFSALRKALNNKYRLYFTNLTELNEWLTAARSYEKVPETPTNHVLTELNHVWFRSYAMKNGEKEVQFLDIAKSLFDDDGMIMPMTQGAWSDDLVSTSRIKPEKEAVEVQPSSVSNNLASLGLPVVN